MGYHALYLQQACHSWTSTCMSVGEIPFTTLKSNLRVSYGLYMPPEHLNQDPSLIDQPDIDSSSLNAVYHLPSLPSSIIYTVCFERPRISRYSQQFWGTRSELPSLAPFFPAGIDSYTGIDNYKNLKYKTMPSDPSDLVLLDMLDDVALWWPGISTDKVFMMGYSGGCQFVHRFIYQHPEKLRAVSIGAPSRIT